MPYNYSYFQCNKCGGTFHPSYQYCPICDEQTQELIQEIRRLNDLLEKRGKT